MSQTFMNNVSVILEQFSLTLVPLVLPFCYLSPLFWIFFLHWNKILCDSRWNLCIFAGIRNCNSLFRGAQLQRGRETVIFRCHSQDGVLTRTAPVLNFPSSCWSPPFLSIPLLKEPAGTVTLRCQLPREMMYWHLLGWLVALMPSLCPSES